MGTKHSGDGRRRSTPSRAARRRLHLRTWSMLAAATLVAAACIPPPQNPSITVIAPSATIDYGDAIPELAPGYTGLPSGVTAPSTPPTCTTTATPTSPPGEYPTTCSGAAHSGATITYTAGSITIEAAPVTVTASDGAMAVGGAVPSITASYSGLKNGETEPDVLPTCSTTATTTSPAGAYPSTCADAADPNYAFTYVDGTVTVAPAVVTVTASSASQQYGTDAPAISATYSGLLFGEDEPATPAACSTTATSSSPAGSYPTTCSGAADPNYTFDYVEGTVTVTPAPVVVTASSTTVPFGTDPGPITADYAGLVNGDTEPTTPATCSTTATSSSPAGSYPATCSGAADPNYTFSYLDGTVTVTASLIPVTVTASSAVVTYGDDVPAITASYDGFGGSQTEPATPATCSTTATSSSPAGIYPTTCSGADDPSHTFDYVAGTVVVLPAAATVTASSESMTYGGSIPTITPEYGGLVNGDTAPATTPTCSTTATAASPTGSYDSTCSGADDPNYTFTYVDGTVEITPALLTVTASDGGSVYGSASPTITASYSGFVNGDTAPATPPTCSTTATSASPTGEYPSTCSGAADPNYTFTYVDGTVTVTPAAAVVTASSETMDEGDDPPAITPSYSGFVNGDTAPATPPTCSTTATSASPTGEYPSTCSGAADPNYTFTYVDGTVTVAPAALPVLTITASSADVDLGAAVPPVTPTYDGLVGGDTGPDTAPTCSTAATSASPIGRYVTTCSGAADPGYTIVYVDGEVDVHPTPGLGAYDPTGYSTTIASGSNGVNLPASTINVAAGTGTGFDTYTNLTVQTSNGPQPVFCKGVSANQLATCSSPSGTSGTMSTGGYVVDKAAHRFDTFSAAGGQAAISPSSLTILEDVPADDRGMPSFVQVSGTRGMIAYTPAAAPSGTFTLTYGICRAGTATYSSANPACTTGTISYQEGQASKLGAVVTASLGIFGSVTSNVYQTVRSATVTPSTVQQGQTFVTRFTPTASGIPRLQSSSAGDATVNNMSRMAAVIPIPSGMTYVNARTYGGDSITSGVATVTYCTAFSSSLPCRASSPTGNYSHSSAPYLIVALPDAVNLPGGAQVSLPNVEVTLKATGPVGTVGQWKLTEFRTRIAASLIINVTTDFMGYPTDDSNESVAPPSAPPVILATNEIVG